MFCPKCGNADQQPESYCRNCGEFLVDHSSSSYLLNKILGGSTPATQINVNLALNLLSIFTCFLLLGFLNGHYDALNARTGEQPPSVIYLVYGFLVVISVWQMLSFVVGARLRSKLGRKATASAPDSAGTPKTLGDRTTLEHLPPANFAQDVPLSVTEDQTKILDPKIARK